MHAPPKAHNVSSTTGVLRIKPHLRPKWEKIEQVRPFDRSIRKFVPDDDMRQARQRQLLDFVPERIPTPECEIQVNPEYAPHFAIEDEPWFVQGKNLGVGARHDGFVPAGLETRCPGRQVYQPTKDVVLVGPKTVFDEGLAVPPTNGFAETTETVIQPAAHRIPPAGSPVDVELINEACSALRRFEFSPEFPEPLRLGPGGLKT